MTDGPLAEGKLIHRMYGVIESVGSKVGIRLADGKLIHREPHKVCVFIQAPPNWSELFSRVEIVCECVTG